MCWTLSAEKMWTREQPPYLSSESPPCNVGRQLNLCCSEACSPASKLPFALNRHWGRFNICWAKTCTPVFLFLLASRPEPPTFSFPPCVFPPLLSYTSLFVLLQAPERSLKSISATGCLAPCVPRPPITQLGIYSGTNQSSCFEADPEGCGFHPWLVIVAVSSGPKWVDASHTQTLHCFTLIYITLSQHFQYECIKFFTTILLPRIECTDCLFGT